MLSADIKVFGHVGEDRTFCLDWTKFNRIMSSYEGLKGAMTVQSRKSTIR